MRSKKEKNLIYYLFSSIIQPGYEKRSWSDMGPNRGCQDSTDSGKPSIPLLAISPFWSVSCSLYNFSPDSILLCYCPLRRGLNKRRAPSCGCWSITSSSMLLVSLRLRMSSQSSLHATRLRLLRKSLSASVATKELRPFNLQGL